MADQLQATDSWIVKAWLDFLLGIGALVYAALFCLPFLAICWWYFRSHGRSLPWYISLAALFVYVIKAGSFADRIAVARVTNFIIGSRESPENPAVEFANLQIQSEFRANVTRAGRELRKASQRMDGDLTKLKDQTARGPR